MLLFLPRSGKNMSTATLLFEHAASLTHGIGSNTKLILGSPISPFL
jgi:hypothetical protein